MNTEFKLADRRPVSIPVIQLNMYVPPQIAARIETLSVRLGCSLTVARCWKSEGGPPVMYCDFRGVIHSSPELLIEVAGTLCAELTIDRQDEIDLFVFINGQRVGVFDGKRVNRDYLIGHGDAPFKWDYNDEGFDQWTTLDSETFANSIDEALAIHPPGHNKSQKDG